MHTHARTQTHTDACSGWAALCVCVCVFAHARAHTHNTHLALPQQITEIWAHTYTYICTCYTYICTCIRAYICIHVYIYTPRSAAAIRRDLGTYIYVHMYVYTCIHMYTCIHIHTSLCRSNKKRFWHCSPWKIPQSCGGFNFFF